MDDGVTEDGRAGRLAVLVLALGSFVGFLAWPPLELNGHFWLTTFLFPAAVLFLGLVGWVYLGVAAAALLVALAGALSFFWFGHLPLGFVLAGLEIMVLWLLLHVGRSQAIPLPLAFLALSSLLVGVGQLAAWAGAGMFLPDGAFFRPAIDTVLLCLLMAVMPRARDRTWSRWLDTGQRRFALLLLLSLLPLTALAITFLADVSRLGITAAGVPEPLWPVAAMMLPLFWGLVAWGSWRAFWVNDASMSIAGLTSEKPVWAEGSTAVPTTTAPSWRDLSGRLTDRQSTAAFFATARRREDGDWSVESASSDTATPGNAGDMDVHPSDVAERNRLLERAAQGEEASAHIRLSLSDEGWRWFYVLALPLDSESESESEADAEAKAGVLLIHLDITSVKEAERQLVQTSKMSVLGEMAAGVAHEINQPLNVIRLATQNLRRRISGESVDLEYYVGKLDRIAAQTRRAADIIDHMRIFGRKPADDPEYFSPPQGVGRVVGLLQSQLDADGIRVQRDCEAERAMCWGHESLFEQVMMNLLVNARDAINAHAEAGGSKEIFVLCSVTGNVLEIRVRDTGGGVPDAVLDRLFQPFFTTKPAGKGTGLGLSLSYGIIQDMNGDISVRNVAGGAEFTVRMPLTEATVESDD
ncbi:ATP-binding protein [Guyparkeria hydrothermalis]|uniref:sensor histidine kinase n=1 Tax=Guyparkeria hydrothermalis TaxID=923 RepID=UPI0020219DC7|nr:ATP-binding protein [Guyparkeria hydrothermalis]MCL7743700.1 ATP-binding protein [Guyparkeria hydrothermalis]